MDKYIPLAKRKVSIKTPYLVQEWCNVRKCWEYRGRSVNIDKAIQKFADALNNRSAGFSAATVAKLNRERPIRLFDTLYQLPIADKDMMTRAKMMAAWANHSPYHMELTALRAVVAEHRASMN